MSTESDDKVIHVKISGKGHKDGRAVTGDNIEVLGRIFNVSADKYEGDWLPLPSTSLSLYAAPYDITHATIEVLPREIEGLIAMAEIVRDESEDELPEADGEEEEDREAVEEYLQGPRGQHDDSPAPKHKPDSVY
ncbi:hypothetical protein SEA_AUSTIN_43 [Gordonia phage Austin]|nr:hypothetical protein SEA_AUSTIN_43 [Gordonia phage Austin]